MIYTERGDACGGQWKYVMEVMITHWKPVPQAQGGTKAAIVIRSVRDLPLHDY